MRSTCPCADCRVRLPGPSRGMLLCASVGGDSHLPHQGPRGAAGCHCRWCPAGGGTNGGGGPPEGADPVTSEEAGPGKRKSTQVHMSGVYVRVCVSYHIVLLIPPLPSPPFPSPPPSCCRHYHEALRARRTSEQLKSVRSLQNFFNFDHEDSPGLIDLEEGPERMSDLAASTDSVFMQCLSSTQGVEPGEKSKTLHSFMSPPSMLHVSSLKVGNSVVTDNPITQSPVVEGTNVAAHQRSWSLNVSPSEGASPEVLHHRRK